MASLESVLQRAFSGGELSPSFATRADLSKYAQGLTTCRNLIVRKSGGVTHRPGTRFMAEVKDSSDACRLFKFVFEADDQTYLIEAGDGYFRFYHDGSQVQVSGVAAWSAVTAYEVGDLASRLGVNYYCILAHTNQQPPNATYWYALTGTIFEVPTPYSAADLAELRGHAQSADIITFTHKSHAPRELRRNGETDWTFEAITFGASIAAPTGGAGTPGAAGSLTFKYKATAAKAETFEESLASATITVASAALPTIAAPIELSVDAQADAGEFYWYKDEFDNGIFGFIGASSGPTFKDAGFAPDYGTTPPTEGDVFDSSGNYPRLSAWYQQRRWFSSTNNDREKIWGSQTGAFANFNRSTPLQPDDSVSFVLASKHLNPPVDLVGLRHALVALTDGGAWAIHGDDTGAIVPTDINAEQVDYRGVDGRVPAVVVGQTIVHAQALGTALRALRVWERDGEGRAVSIDLTTFATHLFDGQRIVAVDYSEQPDPIVWAVRDDGVLLALTIELEADLWGWHRHDTAAAGLFEDVCVIPDRETGEDRVYVVVNRTIDGATVRYIEEFAPRYFAELADVWFVDAGLEYDGTPVQTLTGLDHLEGEVVAVFADGTLIYDGDPAGEDAEQYTVSGGSISLSQSVSRAVAGLPIAVEFQTLDVDQGGSTVREKRKRIPHVVLHLERSLLQFSVGSEAGYLQQARANGWDAGGLRSGPVSVHIAGKWEDRGRIIVQQSAPVPLTITGIAPQVEVGG